MIGLSSGVVAIASGYYHSCALTAAGGVKCWGSNTYGQLGDGATADRLTPVAVTGLSSGGVAIEVGYRHSCALTAAGGVKCWGENSNGQLGDGTTTNRFTPVAVAGLTRGVVAITAGVWHGCALTAAGGAKCWGGNGWSQLGDGTKTNRLTPVSVTGLTSDVVAISGGYLHSCATTGAGGVKCWGWNGYGQLGGGATGDSSTPVDTRNIASLVRARAEFTTPPLAAGAHGLLAYFGGDATHAPSYGWTYQWVR